MIAALLACTLAADAEGWLVIGNDSFPSGADDDRTAWVAAGARVGHVALVADWSVMTDRTRWRRVDELTLAGSWRAGPAWIGAGVRLSGDLGGADLQDRWHTFTRERCYHELDYDDPSRAALAIAGWRDRWDWLELGAEGLLSSAGEACADLTARACSRWAWAGIRQRLHNGTAQSLTARAVASQERGTWVELGVGPRPAVLSIGYNLAGAWCGALTLCIGGPQP